MARWVVRSILQGVDPLSNFSFQPVLHDYKGRGMFHPVCGMMHIKEPLPLIRKSSPCRTMSFTKYLMQYNRVECVLKYNISFVTGKSVRSWCDRSSDRSFMVDPLGYFSFQPVPHDWSNKGRGLTKADAYKRTLAANGKRSLCGCSGFPLSLSEWSFTICLTPRAVNKMC